MDGSQFVPLSALQHYSFCPRQCALIHLDCAWAENVLTTRGELAHRRVDVPHAEIRGGVRFVYGMSLHCDRLQLSGKADCVEFRADGSVYPVEYKHGKRHRRIHDDLQVCAQALCLEEMLETSLPRGALYYHSSRARREVEFTAVMREQVVSTAHAVRELLVAGVLPRAPADARCRNCSLSEICQPIACSTQCDWRKLRHELFHPEDSK